jgi:TIR domain-containing protein
MSSEPEVQKFDIFISYSRRDSEHVNEIVEHLRSSDLRIWYDRQSMLYGKRLRESILEAIKSSSVILVFISPNSVTSTWVLNELDSAMMREINDGTAVVVPVILGRIGDEEIPGDLRGKYYLDLRHNFQKRWQEERDIFTDNIIALVRGEAFGPGAAVLEVGDPLIRYLASYNFRYSRQSSKIENREMAKVGRAFGFVAAQQTMEGDAIAPEITFQPMAEAGKQDDRDRTEVERFLKYSLMGRRFVQRYGEFALQQITLFFIDRTGLDLTGGFTDHELTQLISNVHTMLTFFEIQFAFEAIQADFSHQILLRITPENISAKIIGDIKFT